MSKSQRSFGGSPMLTPTGFKDQQTDTPPRIKEAIVTPAIPHSLDAEEGLLGALAIDPAQMINVGYLRPDDFYISRNSIVYRAMAELWERNQAYDLITLTEHLESAGHLDNIGGGGIIADMINFTPTSYNAAHYAAIVYKNSILRQTINGATKAVQLAYAAGDRSAAEVVNEVVGMFSGIDATRNVSNGPKSISNGVSELLDSMQEIERTGQVAGLQTGIKTLDFVLGGLQSAQFYLLAGRPGMGKSALALQVACNVAKRGSPVLYFSLEMNKKAIAARLTSSICKVPYDAFGRPGIGDKWPAIFNAGEQISRLPLEIEDAPALTVDNMRSIAQKLMLSKPIELVIVDHLGLAKPARPMKDSYHEVSQISHSLMALSKQLNLPVLALCQLSRNVENRANKRPTISDLRDSGKLEEDADGILFVYRDEVYNPDTEFPHLGEIIVAKNRGGNLGVATVYADITTNRFVDLETRRVRL